jgi:NhaA family Na+:H+ antiporter
MAGGSDATHGSAIQRFIHSEVAGSVLMMACTLAALLWANSEWSAYYFELEHLPIGVSWNENEFSMSLGHWIGDGLMVIFFFVVGLEIKREIVVGQLSVMERAVLPVSAALGGMIVPALIYALFAAGTDLRSGWGVPMATDIAFALGILSLFGSRVPIGLKVFLTALAIADDMGAVLVIALFYTEQIVVSGVLLALAFMALLLLLAKLGVRQSWPFVICMIVVWSGVLMSGIHATVAGVLLAMLVPVRSNLDPDEFFGRVKNRIRELEVTELTQHSMITDRQQNEALDDLYLAADDMRPVGLVLERDLHPVQAFLILPIFAFFKAGIPLGEETLSAFPSAASMGVIFGLVLGKPIGVLLFSWLAIRSGRASLPEGVTRMQLFGVSCLAGVGFTMSIFISELAFVDTAVLAEVKLGILVASTIAAAVGYVVLHRAFARVGSD